MKRSSRIAAAIAVALSLGLAGCAGGAGGFTPNAGPGTSAGADAGAAPPDRADATPSEATPGATEDATAVASADTLPDTKATEGAPDSLEPSASKIKLDPTKAALLSVGSISRLGVKVSEPGYTGGFRESNTCRRVAFVTPSFLKKAGKLTLEGKAGGSCAVTIADAIGNKAVLKVSDTVAKIVLGASSISPGSKSVTIVLKSVDGKPPAKHLVTTVTANLTSCASGCTITGPQVPVGKALFSVSIYDGANGAGNVLATGTGAGPLTAGKTTSFPVSLSKSVASVGLSSVPSGTAGTAFGATPLTLVVKDADGNDVVGAYASPVTIASSDTSGATTLGGGTGTATSQNFTSSAQTPTFAYTGLAIAPATLTPSAAGATTGATGSFAPSVSSLSYSGPTIAGNPEIDLYAMSGTGSSANFAVSQAGWTASPYDRNTTYPACSGNAGAYAIAPATGSGNAYTVTATGVATAGTCTLTVNGGAGASVAVKLTYTTSSVGVNEKHSKP